MRKELLSNKIDDFVDYLEEDEKAIKTIGQYRHVCQMFINITQDDDIDKHSVIRFKQYLKDNFATNTVNNYIVIINKFLKFCNCSEYCVKKVKQQNRYVVKDEIEKHEFRRLLKFSKRLGMDDMYMIILVLGLTGIRCEELKFFTVENINKSFYISVFNKQKDRKIVIRQDVRRELKKYCKEHDIKTGYIFMSPTDPSKPICNSTIHRRLKKIAGAAKIKKSKVHPHAFRHLFGNIYLEAGGNLANLADIYGHNDIRTTQTYARKTLEHLRKDVEKMKF